MKKNLVKVKLLAILSIFLLLPVIAAAQDSKISPQKAASNLSWNWQFAGYPPGNNEVEGILIDPDDENLWYVSTIQGGLYITRNGGVTWEHPLSGRGLDMEGYQISPQNSSVIYVTLAETLFVSEDKGISWQKRYVFPEYIRSLLISSIDNSIYVAPQTSDNDSPGIYKSSDGGNSWQHYPFGVSQHYLLCWDIEEDPQNGFLYVAVEIANHPQPYDPPFFRSKDRGVTWEEVSGILPWHGLKIQVNPVNQKLYYLLERGGLYISSDFGDTWNYQDAPLGFTMLLDPKQPEHMFIGDNAFYGAEQSAYFSFNGGDTFIPIGLTGLIVAGFGVNGKGTKIYACCYGSGIYISDIPEELPEENPLVTTTLDSGLFSLRLALEQANGEAGPDTIRFAIPKTDPGYDETTGTWTIRPLKKLPIISDDSLFLDGLSQAEFIGSDLNLSGPELVIDGSLAEPYAAGLKVISSRNVIKGLVINNFDVGIWLEGEGAAENTITGNFIGVDAKGKEAASNRIGIYVSESSFNTIGGDRPDLRNIISGNEQNGILLISNSAHGNKIIGNYIGTDVSGTEGLGNGEMGILMYATVYENRIGGSAPGEGNLISGNGLTGVRIVGLRNEILGNYIGTDVTGTKSIANGQNGILLWGGGFNVVGGIGDNERNLISGNTRMGITIINSDENVVAGNLIGTKADGSGNLGNGEAGVGVQFGSQKNTIGPQNIIAFNGWVGVTFFADSTIENTITENGISNHRGPGIGYVFEGPAPILPPSITEVANGMVSGTAPENSTVEIFSDSDDEGEIYEGKTIADNSGYFQWSGWPTGPHITATATDEAGNTSIFSAPAYLSSVTEKENPGAPNHFELKQNHPNPFNPETIIEYSLAKTSKVEISVFNVQGQRIVSLVNARQSSGSFAAKWNGKDEKGKDVVSGVYFYQIKAGEFIATKKMTLLR